MSKIITSCQLRLSVKWRASGAELTVKIGKDKSFAYDLNRERGIVSMRVAFVPRSAEIQPLFWRFVAHGDLGRTLRSGGEE